jgi:hypothetical protein
MSQTGIDSLRIVFSLQLRLIHADKVLPLACVLAKTIVRDAVKPCGKPRFTAKAPNVLVSANEGFLREIVGQREVCAGELPQQATHTGLMPAHELAECVLIVIEKNSRNKIRIS